MNLGKVFFGKRAAPETRKPSDNPMRHVMGALNRLAMRKMGVGNYKTAIEAQNALKSTIVYQCVDKIALAVMSVGWYAERDPDATETVKSKISNDRIAGYNRLLKNPCHMTGAMWRYWTASKLALEARAVFKAGYYNFEPNAIYPLPGMVGVKTDSYGNVEAYVFGVDETKLQLPTRSKAKDSDGRIAKPFGFEITKPTLGLDLTKGNSPLDAIALPNEIINLLLRRAYDMADGTPNMRHILWTADDLSKNGAGDINEEIEARKIGGDENSGYAFFEGFNLNHIALDDRLSDIHTKIPADDMMRRIAGVFGVPAALINLAGVDGSKFASNYIESRLSFYQDTIIPGYLVPIQEALTANICPKGIRVRFDLDTIPALYEGRLNAIAKLKDAIFLTDDEKRELVGFAAKPSDDTNKQPRL